MEQFLTSLRQTDHYIETIFMNGGCYQLHLLLKSMFPDCEPHISGDHVVTKYQGNFYDITGVVHGIFAPMSDADIERASKWSFYKTNVLTIAECPFCEEPFTI